MRLEPMPPLVRAVLYAQADVNETKADEQLLHAMGHGSEMVVALGAANWRSLRIQTECFALRCSSSVLFRSAAIVSRTLARRWP